MYSCVFIVAIIFFQLCHFDEGITRSIKKIGIIGGGPAGLALAGGLVANLPKSWDGEIILLESRSDILQTGLGGGVQLSGGCKTLESLGLYSEFKRIAEPLTSILARNSRNDVLFELSTRDCLAKHANELLDSDGNPIVYSIMRDSLQSLLYRRLVDDKRVSVLVDSDCKVITEKDNRVGLRLANGTEVNDLDFVFCADGTGSAGPVHVANSWRSWLNPLEALAQGAQQMLNTRYSGLRIVYCVTGEDPTFALRPEPGSRGSFHQFLGDGCYALLASYGGGKGETRGGPSHMLAVIDSGSDNDDTGLNDKENVRWRSQNLRANVAARLRASGLDKLPSLTRILDACEESRFVELKLRDRILPLLHWGSASGRVILVGDSAHSM